MTTPPRLPGKTILPAEDEQPRGDGPGEDDFDPGEVQRMFAERAGERILPTPSGQGLLLKL